MKHDLVPPGEYERLVQPFADKFTLPAEMGLDVRLEPDSARAAAQAIMVLARSLDRMEAEKYADKVFRRLIYGIVGFAVFVWLCAWASA